MRKRDSLKRILVLNFLEVSIPSRRSFELGPLNFEWIEHRIGWDFELGVRLIENSDGEVDAIALVGIQRSLGIGSLQFPHPGFLRLLRAAIKTPIYPPDDLRDLFAAWALHDALQREPKLFWKKEVLVHVSLASPFLKPIEAAGGRITSADLWSLFKIPVLLKGTNSLQKLVKFTHPLLRRNSHQLLSGSLSIHPYRQEGAFSPMKGWVEDADVLVTFYSLLRQFPLTDSDHSQSFPSLLKQLKDKVLVIDYLPPEWRKHLTELGVAKILEFSPNSSGALTHEQKAASPSRSTVADSITHSQVTDFHGLYFSVMSAALDLLRAEQGVKTPLAQFTRDWLTAHQVGPVGLTAPNPEVPKLRVVVYRPLPSLRTRSALESRKSPTLEVRPAEALSLLSPAAKKTIELETFEVVNPQSQLNAISASGSLSMTLNLLEHCERDGVSRLILAYPLARKMGSPSQLKQILGTYSPVQIEDGSRLSLAGTLIQAFQQVPPRKLVVILGAHTRLGQTSEAFLKLQSNRTGKNLRFSRELHEKDTADLVILAGRSLEALSAPLRNGAQIVRLLDLRDPPPTNPIDGQDQGTSKVASLSRSSSAQPLGPPETQVLRGPVLFHIEQTQGSPKCVEPEIAFAALLGFEGFISEDLQPGATPTTEATALLALLDLARKHGIIPNSKSMVSPPIASVGDPPLELNH
jgi:hypothetical protein